MGRPWRGSQRLESNAPSAIDDKRLSSDKSGLVGSQIQGRGCDFVRSTQSPNRLACDESFAHLLYTSICGGQYGNAFTAAFASALRRSGFAVAEDGQPEPAVAHHVRYLVTPLDNGDLARLTIDGSTEGSRFFARNTADGLQAGGPFTVTQTDASR